jgi:hypothetical protein
MREVTDEALQRLYRACRSNSGFPGVIPDESHGPPSTTAILDALGLMQPSLEDMGAIEDVQRPVPTSLSYYTTQSDPSTPQRGETTLSTEESSDQDEHIPSPTHSSFSRQSLAQEPEPGPSLAAVFPLGTAMPSEMDMCEQFRCAASQNSSSRRGSNTIQEKHPNTSYSSDQAFDLDVYLDTDLDVYLDTNSCWVPISGPHPPSRGGVVDRAFLNNICDSKQFDIPGMMETNHVIYPIGTAS